MEELLIAILKSIVKHPGKVSVSTVETDEKHVTLNIEADPEDKGVIIGRQGRTIKALSDILNIKGFDEGKRAYLKLVNNEESTTPLTPQEDEEESI